MMRLSKAFFESSEFKTTTRDDEVRFNCPNCGDVKFHLYYNLTKGLYHCFRCGISGRTSPRKVNYDREVVNKSVEVPVLSDTFSPITLAYLRRRDLMIATVYAKEGSKDNVNRLWRGAIVFSLYPEGYIGRRLSGEPKYVFSKGISTVIWTDLSLLKASSQVFLVEGVFDALRLIQLGLTPIALCGTHFGKGKQELVGSLLRNGIETVYILLDADAEYFARQIEIILKVMLPDVEVVRLVLPHSDPADWDRISLFRFFKKSKVKNLNPYILNLKNLNKNNQKEVTYDER